ncbi:MAG: pyridoxamine 5'-phosphate oxidase family protein [Bacteroidota bacterium]
MENKENVENLSGSEAVKKLQDLIEDESICHFVSNLAKKPLSTRPMSALKVDDNGNIWFFSAKSSEKNADILLSNEVQLFYSNPSAAEFLSIYGKAFIVTDREKAKELWTPLAKAWFKDGVDDPELTMIKVAPVEAYYWDTKNNKVVAMLKILAAVVTGVVDDDGVQGELKV